MRAFLKAFMSIEKRIEKENKSKHGLYFLPLHRVFAFYLTRLVVGNIMDPKVKEGLKEMNLQQAFRAIFMVNLPKEFQEAIKKEKKEEQWGDNNKETAKEEIEIPMEREEPKDNHHFHLNLGNIIK